MNILALLFALLFPQAAPPFSAQVSVQVFHGTAPFHGTIQVVDVTDPLATNRINIWVLDANGKASDNVTLDRTPPYEIRVINDSNVNPRQRGIIPFGFQHVKFLDPQPNIAFEIHMDGIADAKSGLYPSVYPTLPGGIPFQ